MEQTPSLQSIPDDELLRRLGELLRESRRVESDLVAHIAEVDERRLYAREASPSMFAYCTEVLHLSEAEAYLRIAAARASRRHPQLLSMLVHLSGIGRLGPHLTDGNVEGLLERAVHKSKRQIEELIAELLPRPDAPDVMRKLPAPRGRTQLTAGLSLGEGELASSVELGPIHELPPDGVAMPDPEAGVPSLRPGGAFMPDPETGLEQAASHALRPGGVDASQTSRETSPVPPAAVRRAVTARDGNRCRYVDAEGRRCTERHRLEFHHRRPFGLGGDHDPRNIWLACRSHNLYFAAHDYGRRAMEHSRFSSRLSEAKPASIGRRPEPVGPGVAAPRAVRPV